MKTTTIYRARNIAANRWSAGYFDVAERQFGTFEAELLRRMDAGDEWRMTFPMSTPGEIVGALSIHTATRGILDKRKVMR